MTTQYWNLEETLKWEAEDGQYPRWFKSNGEFRKYTITAEIIDGLEKHWHVRVSDFDGSPEWTYPMAFANSKSAKWFCEYHNIMYTHIDKGE